MSKVVFWVLVILVILLLSRLAGRAAVKRRDGRPTSRPDIPRPPRRPVAMVQCAHCGVHLPESDAVRHQGQHWCSLEHAGQGTGDASATKDH